MVEYDGENYVTATEVAQRFKISRSTCYNNVLRHVESYYLPGRRKALYRQSEIERFSEVRVVVAHQLGMRLQAASTEGKKA